MHVFYQTNDPVIRVTGDENLSFPSHLHRQVELFFIEDGEISVVYNFQPFSLYKGDLCIIFPNTVHSYETPSHSKASIVLANTELIVDFADILTKYQCDHPFVRCSDMEPEMLHSYRRILELCNRSSDVRLIKGYLYILFSYFLACMKLHPREYNVNLNTAHQALTYISQNYKENLTLENVSHQLGISKSHLSRCFAEKLGCNFIEYINMLRINEACRLLSTTESSIIQISFDCGFNSQRTFNRVFLKVCGISPKEYRKKYTTDHNQILSSMIHPITTP